MAIQIPSGIAVQLAAIPAIDTEELGYVDIRSSIRFYNMRQCEFVTGSTHTSQTQIRILFPMNLVYLANFLSFDFVYALFVLPCLFPVNYSEPWIYSSEEDSSNLH